VRPGRLRLFLVNEWLRRIAGPSGALLPGWVKAYIWLTRAFLKITASA
jgi:hypothetical protein